MNAPVAHTSLQPDFVQRPIPEEFLQALQTRFGSQCSTALAVREQHGRDEGAIAAPPPAAVVFAESTQDVQDANQRTSEMSTVSRDIPRDVEAEDGITGDIRAGGEQVQASAEELSRLAEQLKGLVGQFKF